MLYTLSAIGVFLILVLFFMKEIEGSKASDAIGLAGAAFIAGAIAIYVGQRTDDNAKTISKGANDNAKTISDGANSNAATIGHNADENTRTVGINNILAQVETVIDSHQGTRPCIRYVLKAGLVSNLVDDHVPDAASIEANATDETRKAKSECLGGLYIKQPSLLGHDAPEIEWIYTRGEIMAFLNVIELAAAYSSSEKAVKHNEAESTFPLKTGQQMLVRYLDGILTSEEGFGILHAWHEYERRKPEFAGETIEELWVVCRTIDCTQTR
jgi:hypothetical protein